jgi:hypothetical protein
MQLSFLAGSLLFIPLYCAALGAEDTEYYGNLSNGQLLRLRLVSDPQPWSRQNFIYGAQGSTKLALCWNQRVNEVRRSFVCTSSRGIEPALVYELLGSPDRPPSYGDQTLQGAEYRAIAAKAKLGNGTKRGHRTLEAIYSCKSGCTSETPKFLYEVATFD